MRDFRPYLASLTSPMVALFPVATVAVRQLDDPTRLATQPGGETPLRAVGLFLMLFPIFYLLLALGAHLMARSFLRLRLDTRRRFVAGAGALALAAAPLAAAAAHWAQLPGAQSWLGAWGALSALFVLSALPSAAAWWWISGPGRRHLAGRPESGS